MPFIAEPRARVAWEALQQSQKYAPQSAPLEQALSNPGAATLDGLIDRSKQRGFSAIEHFAHSPDEGVQRGKWLFDERRAPRHTWRTIASFRYADRKTTLISRRAGANRSAKWPLIWGITTSVSSRWIVSR